MKKLFSLFCCIAIGGVFVFLSGAATVSALTISPILLEYEGLPGSTGSRNVDVRNDDDVSITIQPKLYQVVSQDESGFPVPAPLTEQATISEWISLAGFETIPLAPHEKKSVPIAFHIPVTAHPGGYYAILSWKAASNDTNVAIAPSPGVNIAVSVSGPITQKGEILDFGPEQQQGRGLTLPIQLRARIKNDGGIHFYPEGTIVIRNFFGIVVAKIPVTASRATQRLGRTHPNGSILPGATRELTGTWEHAFALGPYSATIYLDAQGAGQLVASRSFFVTSPILWYSGYAVLSLLIALLFTRGVRIIRIVFNKNRYDTRHR